MAYGYRRYRRSRKPSPESSVPKGPMVSEYNGGAKHTEIHLTYDEYLEQAINGVPATGSITAGGDSTRSSRDTYRNHWSGNESFEATVKLAQEGWTEGREKIGEIVAELDNLEAGLVTVPQTVHAVCGHRVDVAAFVRGTPHCMVRWQETETVKRVARILFNMGVSGGVSTDAIEWKGATVLALIDRLEAQGIRVELDVCDCSSAHNDETDTVYFNLKKSEEPLHLDRLAFHLVNPSSLRRLFFSFQECRDAETVHRMGYYKNGSYGNPRRVTEAMAPGYDLIVPELELYSVQSSVKAIEQMFQTVCDAGKLTIDE